jgi:hypothetical protein
MRDASLLWLFIVSNRDHTYYFADNIARYFDLNAHERRGLIVTHLY